MKAYISTGKSDTRVELTEVDAPKPAPGHAIVRVEAISLNRGELGGLATAGARPGWDFAGMVASAAPDGQGPRAGTRVAGVINGGAWAEQISVPVGQIGELPDGIGMDAASTLGIAGLTALRVLRAAGTTSGRRILVTGGAGAVGRFAVQLGALYAGHVTAMVSREDQVEGVKALGAEAVAVADAPIEGPFDIVIDGVAGPALEAGIRAAGPGARILTFGIASGKPAQIKFADFRGAPGSALQGFFIWQSDLASFGRDLSYLATLAAGGVLEAHVAKHFAWQDLNDGLTALATRAVSGKIVVKVAG